MNVERHRTWIAFVALLAALFLISAPAIAAQDIDKAVTTLDNGIGNDGIEESDDDHDRGIGNDDRTTGKPDSDDPVEDPPAEDPPVEDEPADDAPVDDTPATDEPSDDGNNGIGNDDIDESDDDHDQGIGNDDPTDDQPDTDEPVDDTPATDEPIDDGNNGIGNDDIDESDDDHDQGIGNDDRDDQPLTPIEIPVISNPGTPSGPSLTPPSDDEPTLSIIETPEPIADTPTTPAPPVSIGSLPTSGSLPTTGGTSTPTTVAVIQTGIGGTGGQSSLIPATLPVFTVAPSTNAAGNSPATVLAAAPIEEEIKVLVTVETPAETEALTTDADQPRSVGVPAAELIAAGSTNIAFSADAAPSVMQTAAQAAAQLAVPAAAMGALSLFGWAIKPSALKAATTLAGLFG